MSSILQCGNLCCNFDHSWTSRFPFIFCLCLLYNCYLPGYVASVDERSPQSLPPFLLLVTSFHPLILLTRQILLNSNSAFTHWGQICHTLGVLPKDLLVVSELIYKESLLNKSFRQWFKPISHSRWPVYYISIEWISHFMHFNLKIILNYENVLQIVSYMSLLSYIITKSILKN